jgi:hypothetical protein
LNIHILITDCKSQQKIEKEAEKIIKLIPRVNLKLGQRLPIHSKVNQGKWFIFRNEKNIYSILLSFPQSDENLIERFLLKMRNTLKEIESIKDSQQNFESILTNKIIKYGIHHLRDISALHQIEKISFNDNLFESNNRVQKNVLEDESTGTFSNELPKNDTENFSDLKPKYDQTPIKPKKKKSKFEFEENEEDEEKVEETNDFFNFKMEKKNSSVKKSNQIKSADICVKLENKFNDVSFSNKKKNNSKTNNKGKNIKIARYTLLIFFVLMFMVIGKMFLGLSNSSMIVVNNSVRHSSTRKNHSKNLL